MDKEAKAAIKKDYQVHQQDTGSVEVQVALLTKRINDLTEHLQLNRKDHSSRRGLIMMVNKRRRLLSYIHRRHQDRYSSLIQRLGLRH